MRKTKSIISASSVATVSLFMCCPSVLMANEPVETNAAAKQVALEEGTKVTTITASGPIGRSTGASDGENGASQEFQVTTVDGSAVGEFALSWNKSSVEDSELPNGGTEISFKKRTTSVKLAFPLAQDNDASFLDFAQIGNDAKASFDVVFYSDKRIVGKPFQEQLIPIVAACIEAVGQSWLQEDGVRLQDGQTQQGLIDQARTEYSSARGATYSRKLGRLSNSPFKTKVQKECDTTADGPIGDIYDLIDRYQAQANFTPEQRRRFNRQFLQSRLTTFWGMSGNAGYEEFELLRPADFRIDRTDRIGFELEGFAGFIQNNGDFTGRLSASYARGYEAAEEQEVCQPGTDGAESCLRAPVDDPVKKESFFIKAEARVILDRDQNGAPKIALAPLVSYNTDESEFLIDLPLYLIQSKDKGLDAGVRLGYGSKNDEVVFGFFVGAPLDNLF